ncbi:gamma-glutamylcyclotransferase [Methylotuvimicrobium sp. KM1]|uniref:gamma-glutamylcyclotransferase family protein n=1 Tax=Methylotuvimicrobium sp. KM1 TaxID=3377707 RepID=UPI00384B26AD
MKRLKKRQTHYLFVYGTLRKNHGHPMSRWLNQRADWIGPGYFQGKLFNLGKYPGVVKSNKAGDRVLGDIYRTDHPKMILTTLDRYEQCSIGDSRPHEYARSIEPVMFGQGQILNAWVYLYNRPIEGLICITSGDYLATSAKQSIGQTR